MTLHCNIISHWLGAYPADNVTLKHVEWQLKSQWKISFLTYYLAHIFFGVQWNVIFTLNTLNYLKNYKRCSHISYHIFNFFSTEEVLSPNPQWSNLTCCIYPILSIPWLLIPWRLTEPGHQQAWFWPNKLEYSISSIRRVKSLKTLASVKIYDKKTYGFVNIGSGNGLLPGGLLYFKHGLTLNNPSMDKQLHPLSVIKCGMKLL